VDPLIVKSGLSFRVDASLQSSYPGSGTTWYDLSGNGNHLTWISSVAPVLTSYNGFGVMRITPTVSTVRAIKTSTYKGLRTGSSPYTAVAAYKLNAQCSGCTLISLGNRSDTTAGDIIHPLGITFQNRYCGGSYGLRGTSGTNAGTGVATSTTSYVTQITTYDGTTEIVYINGVFDKQASMTSSTPVSASNILALGFIGSASWSLDADIGFILMYNRSLSPVEVATVHNAYAGRFGLFQVAGNISKEPCVSVTLP
jgi:hypothetical protein